MYKQINSIVISSLMVSCVWFLQLSCSHNKQKPVDGPGTEQTVKERDSAEIETLIKEEKIPSFEAYCKSIPIGEEVEFFELSWPGDDRLCESYDKTDGPLTYRVYRLKESKRIVRIYEEGAFCQGDSDFGYYFLFDQNGNAIYSQNVALFPSITFYESGKEMIEVEYDSEFDITDFRKIKKINSGEVLTTKEYENKIEEYRETMRERSASLRTFIAKTNDADDIKEAESLIEQLQSSLRKKVEYQDGYVYRKPLPMEEGKSGELCMVNALDIRVRAEPNSTSKVISKVSYYNNHIEVIDIEGMETIEPLGTHPWYKINFIDWNASAPETTEGWIFGAFIVPDIFEKRE